VNANPRPIVFLDVDGALLPFGDSVVPPAALESVAQADTANPLLSRIDRRLGPLLTSLGCELIWATTWMDDANEVISPLLGLPRLCVIKPLDDEDEQGANGLQWKTTPIVRAAAGRDFVWIDDVIGPTDRLWIEFEHPGAALLHKVNPAIGLTAPGLAEIADWLAEHER